MQFLCVQKKKKGNFKWKCMKCGIFPYMKETLDGTSKFKQNLLCSFCLCFLGLCARLLSCTGQREVPSATCVVGADAGKHRAEKKQGVIFSFKGKEQ